MNWIQKNFKKIIYAAFLVPILAVAFVSISHVTKWYGLSNPYTWAIYLSVGIEIAALSALAAISAQMGRKVYFPFGIVTLIQFIGNIFFAYQYIDVNGQSFKDWVDMVDPFVSLLGVNSGDIIGHKRFLALFSGGMLPIISLSFLHMLVKFEEDEKNKIKNPEKLNEVVPVFNIDEISKEIGKKEGDFEKEKYTPTEEQLRILEQELIKLNNQKFGSLTENIEKEKFTSTEEQPLTSITEPINDKINIELIKNEGPLDEDKKINRLSYIRRDG